jgi:pimeloyl-ACP methyl ester carboxylesterase
VGLRTGHDRGEPKPAPKRNDVIREEAAGQAGLWRKRRCWLTVLLCGVAMVTALGFWIGLGDGPRWRPNVTAEDHLSVIGRPTEGVSEPPQAGASDARPIATEIEFTECWFVMPADHHASCGVLTVPERWQADRSRALHLKFVVFRASVLPAVEPMIYVNGGPGDAAGIDERSIGRWWALIDKTSWLKARDLVVFDPRGVGLSKPSLNCHELGDAAALIFGQSLSLEQSNSAWSRAAGQCQERLHELGVELDQYTTEANIADLHSLIAHLGYRSWTLLAVSYGSRVALGLIDRWPEGTSAVILDSVYPNGEVAYADAGKSAAGAFSQLFKECDAHRSCRSDFPQIAATFERVVRRAAVTPIAISLANPSGGPRLQARLDDSRLIDVLVHAFYNWQDIARLPAIITALDEGDVRPLEHLADITAGVYASEEISHGVFFSVECRDAFPFPDHDAIERTITEVPLYRSFVLSNLLLAVCPNWPIDRAEPRERAAVNREVPILVLSGEIDPFTPPQWARVLASTRKAVQIEFRGVGHGVLDAHACAGRIVARFLRDPTGSPVDDCLLAVGTGSSGK